MTIYIRKDGTISGSNEPLPMKPRSSCPGRGFCTCDDPPAKRCEILEWQEALTAWKESCKDFKDQMEIRKRLLEAKLMSYIVKPDTIIENVDVETEEVNLTIPCPDGIEGCEVLHYRTVLRIKDKQ